MDLEEFKNAQNNVIHITESRGLTFLSVVQPTSPIDGDISILPIKLHGSAHRTTSGGLTKVEKPVKNRAVLADIKPLQLTRVGMVLNNIGANSREKFDVLR